jgi:hypothetical protein
VLGRIFGLQGDESAFVAVALPPIFFWELSVGLWMTFKGFNPSALAALKFDPDQIDGSQEQTASRAVVAEGVA